MKLYKTSGRLATRYLAWVVTLSFSLLMFVNCGALGSQIARQALESALEQSLSTYHNVSVSITTNNRSASFSCSKEGTGTYTQSDAGSEICWESKTSNCGFEGDKGKVEINGNNKLCYGSSVKLDPNGGLSELSKASTIKFSGSITVTVTSSGGKSSAKSTCSYDVKGTVKSSQEGGQSCAQIVLDGSVSCGLRDQLTLNGSSFKICVSAEVQKQ